MVHTLTSTADQLLTALVEHSFQRGLSSLAASFGSGFGVGGDGTAGLSARALVAVLSGARSSLLNLGISAARLDTANPLSSFFAGAATTTNSAAVTARVVSGTSVSTAPTSGSYSVTVGQLAVAQVNAGTALTSSATSAFATGLNTVRITQNGGTTDVSFTVGASDSNATVLTSFANAVNGTAGLGVTAAVVTDDAGGTSRLVFTATATGTGSAFSLTNVAGTPVTNAGVSTATTGAANASYAVNGTTYTASSNEVYLGTTGNVHLTLVGTTSTPVVVAVGPETTQIASAITGFVNDYNTARSFFDSNPDVVSGAAGQLASVLARSTAQLRSIGIDTAADGSLSIDSARLSAVLAQNPSTVRSYLGDVGGFAKEVRAIADTQLSLPSVARNPLPPYQPGGSAQARAGAFAARLSGLVVRGMLVDALL